MGGHAAWRKRVAVGEPAKGMGGAIMRHRPRLGRRGDDLALNRLGNIGGRPNPKKKRRQKREKTVVNEKSAERYPAMHVLAIVGIGLVTGYAFVLVSGWNSF